MDTSQSLRIRCQFIQMETNLAFASAKWLASQIRRRNIGCLELLDFYLDRVRQHNPGLNAIIALDIEAACKRAKTADRAMRSGRNLGPLHGIPMTVKESFDVVGMPTTWGLTTFSDSFPDHNAIAVDRLLAAGANVFGKTNVPVMLADWQTFNPLYGTTRNPWNPERTPGGSSGGAACALAAGMTALELGSDIGASIRNPAHYCGVYGHKPTYGVCCADGQNLRGVLTHKDIAVIGPMARHAEDLSLALDVIAGPSLIDSRGWQLELPRPGKLRLRDLRIGVVLSAKTAEVDDSVQMAIGEVVRFLSQAGASISYRAPEFDLDEAHLTFIQLLRSATSSSLSDAQFHEACEVARDADLSSDDYAQWMVIAQCMAHREWQSWNEKRTRMALAWESYFEHHDFLLCPAASTTAFPHNHEGQRWERMVTVNGRPQPSTRQMFWAGFSGMAYLPSTVAPVGLAADGLPVGVQIVGRRYSDHACIALATLLEKEFCAFSPPPGFC